MNTSRQWRRRPPLSTHPATVRARRRRKALLAAARAHLGRRCWVCKLLVAARHAEFHHLVPETKVANVSTLAGRASNAVFWHEVSKCVLVCKWCHADYHRTHSPNTILDYSPDPASNESENPDEYSPDPAADPAPWGVPF